MVLVGVTTATPVSAQQAQIPTLQVCNNTQINGSGVVKLTRRADAQHSGSFKIGIEVRCSPPGYPTGGFSINIDMSDSNAQGIVKAVTVDQVTTVGKHTPTAYLNGRCDGGGVKGCRYWLMLADNGKLGKDTPDVVGFLILDGSGNRAAYGTGPLADGDISIAPN
jgi:hypothetical protein